jgi:hypothetical protein
LGGVPKGDVLELGVDVDGKDAELGVDSNDTEFCFGGVDPKGEPKGNELVCSAADPNGGEACLDVDPKLFFEIDSDGKLDELKGVPNGGVLELGVDANGKDDELGVASNDTEFCFGGVDPKGEVDCFDAKGDDEPLFVAGGWD